jgi:hypothetical protein
MTRDTQSAASPDADSSSLRASGGVTDPDDGPVLSEIHINTPSLRLDASAVVDTTAMNERAGRYLQRLVFAILLLASGLLLDARRVGDAAALFLL